MSQTGEEQAWVDRWRTPEGLALAVRTWAALIRGNALTPGDYETVDGRLDLRGLPVPTPKVLDRYDYEGWFIEELGDVPELQRSELAALDLRRADLRNVKLFEAQVSNSLFDGASCRGLRFWGSTITDCSFARADLRETGVGTGQFKAKRFGKAKTNSWENVSFRGADLREASINQARFVGCDFTLARLDKVSFSQCEIARTVFAGPMSEVLFDARSVRDTPAPPPMRDVDFARAMFDSVEFLGCSFEGIRLPDDPDLRVIHDYRRVLTAVMADLESDPSERAGILLRSLRYTAKSTLDWPESDALFNRRDYDDSDDPDFAAFADAAFRRAETRAR